MSVKLVEEKIIIQKFTKNLLNQKALNQVIKHKNFV